MCVKALVGTRPSHVLVFFISHCGATAHNMEGKRCAAEPGLQLRGDRRALNVLKTYSKYAVLALPVGDRPARSRALRDARDPHVGAWSGTVVGCVLRYSDKRQFAVHCGNLNRRTTVCQRAVLARARGRKQAQRNGERKRSIQVEGSHRAPSDSLTQPARAVACQHGVASVSPGSALPVGAADFARYVPWLPAMNLP